MALKGMMKLILMIIYMVIGIYLIILPFDLFTLPDAIAKIETGILFIGGVMMIWVGLNYMLAKRKAKKLQAANAPPEPAPPVQPAQ